MNKERFSLLLLEPNEVYFEDFSVDMATAKDLALNNQSEFMTGHLKLCSKSLVFDPRIQTLPLLKIHYKDCENIFEHLIQYSIQKYLVIRCKQYIEMLDNNILVPYKFQAQYKIFVFKFHYADVSDCTSQIKQLYRASSLHAIEQSSMIAAIVFSRHSRVKFNPLWLDNIYEKILCEFKVDEINPLVLNPGRLLLTSTFLYFQPYNNIQRYPVIKINLEVICEIVTRRFLLRHTGVEMKYKSDKEKILYVSFRNENERNNFLSKIKNTKVTIPSVEPDSMTLKWQNHLLPNYDYLMYLNSLADRTFRDLTQYPVFPWVIKDYISKELDLSDENVYRDLTKPVGALNPERLSRLKERFEEMAEPKFIYGSHYSTPGFVLFYLVRKHPQLMLCLQNGRFDHPDRMFNSVADTFNNCLLNMSDFKELIPEFYDTENAGDFLINSKKVNFGYRSDGNPVNHVSLPPWAKSSPELFVKTLREALESDFVSSNLHHWIDLVFGYKQRGEQALKSDNLFYHLCYEGSVDLDEVKDLSARHALEIQISEFGQIPKQLFSKPHVARIKNSPDSDESTNNGIFGFTENMTLNLKVRYTAHKETINDITIDGETIISAGKDGIVKVFNISQQRQVRSISLGSLPLSACIKINNCNVLIIASWDNTISLYNYDYGKISDVIPAHDDAVSCLNLIQDMGILISGSWDCSVKVWKGFTNIDYKTFRISDSMIGYLELDDRVLFLDSCKSNDGIYVAIGVSNGQVILWEIILLDITKFDGIKAKDPKFLVDHNRKVTCLAFNKLGTKLVSCTEDSLRVIDVETGMELFLQEVPIVPSCLDWCGDTNLLLMGSECGSLTIWDLNIGNLLKTIKICDTLSCVKYMVDMHLIVIAGKEKYDNQISCWSIV